ncbi:hypothetical protein LTR39_001133, partial [Cryomyces antarcticus]
KPFPCTVIDQATSQQCNKAFDTARQLRGHEGRDHGGIRYWCTLCDTYDASLEGDINDQKHPGFSTYTELQEHIRIDHPPECPHCNQLCATQRELRTHIEIHHADVDDRRTFICEHPNCGRGFTKKGNLNVHVRTVHGVEKRFVCGQLDSSMSKKISGWNGQNACGRGFGTKANLEEHIRTQHMGLPGTAKTKSKKDKTSDSTVSAQVPRASALARLTGAGYAEESGRDIACVLPPCPHRFLREYDLEVHLQAKHGMADDQVTDVFVEYRALQGGEFWIGGGAERAGVLDEADALLAYNLGQALAHDRRPEPSQDELFPTRDNFHDGGLLAWDQHRPDTQHAQKKGRVCHQSTDFVLPGDMEGHEHSFIDPALEYLQPNVASFGASVTVPETGCMS